MRADAPVILQEAGKRGPLLADIAEGIDLTAVDISQQHRRDCAAASRREVGVDAAGGQRPRRVVGAEADTAHDALAAEAIVEGTEKLPTELVSVFAPGDGDIIREHLDQVLAAVVGLAAPRAVSVAKGELHEIVIA